MSEANVSPCAKSVTTQLAELKRHELRRNMSEVNISPCAKSVTTQLAELKRHELRRNNARRSSEELFNALISNLRRMIGF